MEEMEELIGMFRQIVTDQQKNKIEQQYRGVKDGIFYSGSVLVDGVLYPCEATNENFYSDGDNVKCLISDNRTRASLL